MKVVVTALGTDSDSQVDPHFGRARYFLFVDTETGQIKSHDNSAGVNAAQGAGIQAGQLVVSQGAEAVVTGSVGPKAFRALQAGKVAVYVGAAGSIQDALADLEAGRLERASAPTNAGHGT